eukprot:TRINITY_DN1839_c1_g2_i1.p1 TRINITY_DN1839_c1_g2~~TRINITY_DN1839_c1_g2_i1.p1  ORF type:complete len:138 (+),score=26.68 TRINITY_DN1839_c1_g2_i1:82-495(+)
MPVGPWQPFVDDILVGSGKCSAGIIIGHEGAIFAYSANLSNLSQAEMNFIANSFALPEEEAASAFQSTGIIISGAKYITLRAQLDDGLVYGKLGPAGCCISRTGSTIVIGIYSKGMTGGECNMVTEGLAEYLSEEGW